MKFPSNRLASLALAFAVVPCGVVQADMTILADESATLSGEQAPGTVTMKTGSTLTVAGDAVVTDANIKLDGKFATVDIRPGARLSGGGFTYGGNTSYGANAHSNTVSLVGPATVWDAPVFLTRNYSSPNQARGDKWTKVVVTNGVSITNAKFGNNAIDEDDSHWFFRSASLALTENVSMDYANRTTLEFADHATLASSGGVNVGNVDNRLLVHGADAGVVLAGALTQKGTRTRVEFLDGATGVVQSVSGGGASDNTRFCLAGAGTRFETLQYFEKGGVSGANSQRQCEALVEDGAELIVGTYLQWCYNNAAFGNRFIVRDRANVTVGDAARFGLRVSSSGTYPADNATNYVIAVSNATFSAQSLFVSTAWSNDVQVVDGATVTTASGFDFYGPAARLLVRNANLTLGGGLSGNGNFSLGSVAEPAQVILVGTNAVVRASGFGNSSGANVQADLTFVIGQEGRSVDEPFLVLSGGFQSAANYLFPPDVKLHLDIDREWARSGTNNVIALVEMSLESKNKNGNFSGFLGLADTVSAEELKGCTLEYVPNRNGNANRKLILRAGKATKGLILIYK